MPLTPHWTFSVSGEYLKLNSSLTGETIYFLKRFTYFVPIDETANFKVNGLSTDIIKTLNRNEFVTPAPGASLTAFLDSLMVLASA